MVVVWLCCEGCERDSASLIAGRNSGSVIAAGSDSTGKFQLFVVVVVVLFLS